MINKFNLALVGKIDDNVKEDLSYPLKTELDVTGLLNIDIQTIFFMR